MLQRNEAYLSQDRFGSFASFRIGSGGDLTSAPPRKLS